MSLVEALDLYLSSYHTADTQQSTAYQQLVDLHRSLHSPSSTLPLHDSALLLSSLPLSVLQPLHSALDWLLHETRLHMEDESDSRLTALLLRIAQYSTLKDDIAERQRLLTTSLTSLPLTSHL